MTVIPTWAMNMECMILTVVEMEEQMSHPVVTMCVKSRQMMGHKAFINDLIPSMLVWKYRCAKEDNRGSIDNISLHSDQP